MTTMTTPSVIAERVIHFRRRLRVAFFCLLAVRHLDHRLAVPVGSSIDSPEPDGFSPGITGGERNVR